MPLLGFTYLLQLLDKVAIGYSALLNMRADLGLVGNQYSWATSIFYFGYFFGRSQLPGSLFASPSGNSTAGFFGGLLSYAIGHIHGKLYSWQYMYLLFGCLTAGWGLVLVWYLPDAPDKARFLNREEGYLAIERTRDTQQKVHAKELKLYQAWEALRDPQVWLICINMFGCMLVNSGFSSVSVPSGNPGT